MITPERELRWRRAERARRRAADLAQRAERHRGAVRDFQRWVCAFAEFPPPFADRVIAWRVPRLPPPEFRDRGLY